MRILVTSIGSISAPFVISTIQQMGIKIIGTDIYPRKWIATSNEVEYFYQVPRVSNATLYRRKILEICLKHKIGMIIPLTDVEVDYFSEQIEEFKKRKIVIGISKSEVVKFVRNKMKVFEAFKDTKIKVIPTYTPQNYVRQCNFFPCVAKRVDGRSSEGMLVLNNARSLSLIELNDRNYVIQPYIKGDVVTVDLLKGDSGKNIYIARKELTRTVNGAGIAVEIISDKRLEKILEYLCETIDFQGCINIEFIKSGPTYYLMDINPRFSAGVVFSNYAGYNFVKNHILYFLGKNTEVLTDVKFGMIITRKYLEVLV